MKIFVDGSKRAAVSRMFSVWKKMGHDVVDTPKEADVQLSVIKISVKSGLPVVLRLDGIYYDKAENYNARNSAISRAHSMADAVVYQSKFSKIMCEKYLAKRKTKIYDIVYNGVDPSRWSNPKEHDGINVVSCAKWRRWKRLPETIEVFAEFLKHYPESKLHIVGPMKRGSKVIQHKNVIYHNPTQKISAEKIKEIYQTMDMYIHIAKKDWCPSSVVEAIATGLPVITTDACGGAAEMCELTEGCTVVPDESKSLELGYSYKDPYNKLSVETKNYLLQAMMGAAKDRQRVVLPEELTIDHAAKKYVKLMEKIL